MALPKLNTIEYFCKLPVSGIEAKYRPFTVGEQKVLLQALEDGDTKTVSHTVINLVDSCSTLEENYTIKDLANTDLEYLFLQTRIKSVGEKTKVILGCENQPECDGTTEVEVDINEIEVTGKIGDPKVMITDTVGVNLRVPSFRDVTDIMGKKAEIGTAEIFTILTRSIESIFDENDVHQRADFTDKELQDFIDELSIEQFNHMMEWFQDLPKLTKTVDYACSKCSHPNKMLLEGIQNFFA